MNKYRPRRVQGEVAGARNSMGRPHQRRRIIGRRVLLSARGRVGSRLYLQITSCGIARLGAMRRRGASKGRVDPIFHSGYGLAWDMSVARRCCRYQNISEATMGERCKQRRGGDIWSRQ